MKYMPNVAYLELNDFNSDMSLKPAVNQGKPAVVMCQGLFCGYCSQAKPAFVAFANETKGKITACTIQIDSETDLSKKIVELDKNYMGVPIYLGFNANGKYVRTHSGGRDKDSLFAFAATL